MAPTIRTYLRHDSASLWLSTAALALVPTGQSAESDRRESNIASGAFDLEFVKNTQTVPKDIRRKWTNAKRML
ncbi:hypothetical protein C8J57DRAFT_652049 [Mycena rebaudengoi]|nr:hypothetical protein C8J57DRAFT_652049 [Mycena rebaudengoi]